MQASPPPMQPQSPRPAGSGTDAQQDTTHTLYNQAYTQQHQSPYEQVSPMSPGQTLQTATGPAPILGPQLASANLLGVTGTEAWQFQNMAAAYQTQSWHGQLPVNSTGQAQTQTLRDSRVDSYSTVETLNATNSGSRNLLQKMGVCKRRTKRTDHTRVLAIREPPRGPKSGSSKATVSQVEGYKSASPTKILLLLMQNPGRQHCNCSLQSHPPEEMQADQSLCKRRGFAIDIYIVLSR